MTEGKGQGMEFSRRVAARPCGIGGGRDTQRFVAMGLTLLVDRLSLCCNIANDEDARGCIGFLLSCSLPAGAADNRQRARHNMGRDVEQRRSEPNPTSRS